MIIHRTVLKFFEILRDIKILHIMIGVLTPPRDVDRKLFPDNTIPNMINKINKPQLGSFVFRNVFFYLQWENSSAVENNSNSSNHDSQSLYLVTQHKTRRLATPHKHGQRSKYIVKPEGVVEVGNHVVWSYVRGGSFH